MAPSPKKSGKPSYLGLLNAIAQAESRAHAYLTEWAARTDDPDVRGVLLTVAAREGEHGMSFAKRVNELGFEIQPRPVDADEEERAAIAASDRADLEKFDALGYGRRRDDASPDVFDRFFADHSIDPTTGALLGRYIAEERDSERQLRACRARLARMARSATA